jgi:hypothetical protein
LSFQPPFYETIEEHCNHGLDVSKARNSCQQVSSHEASGFQVTTLLCYFDNTEKNEFLLSAFWYAASQKRLGVKREKLNTAPSVGPTLLALDAAISVNWLVPFSECFFSARQRREFPQCFINHVASVWCHSE